MPTPAEAFFWPANFDVLAAWYRSDTTQLMLAWLEEEHLNNAIKAEDQLDLKKRAHHKTAARVYLDIYKTLKSLERRETARDECRAQQARAVELQQQTNTG